MFPIIDYSNIWLVVRESLCESGRCIDALKKRGRALKKTGRVLKKSGRVLEKRGRVLKKVCLVRGTGGGTLLQNEGGGFLRGGGGFLRTLCKQQVWRPLRSSNPLLPTLSVSPLNRVEINSQEIYPVIPALHNATPRLPLFRVIPQR